MYGDKRGDWDGHRNDNVDFEFDKDKFSKNCFANESLRIEPRFYCRTTNETYKLEKKDLNHEVFPSL